MLDVAAFDSPNVCKALFDDSAAQFSRTVTNVPRPHGHGTQLLRDLICSTSSTGPETRGSARENRTSFATRDRTQSFSSAF